MQFIVRETTLLAGTFNIYKHLNTARTEDDLHDLLSVPDLSVCGLQEINWNIKIQLLPEGWTFFQPDGREARKDPILWHADVWKYMKHGSVQITDRRVSANTSIPARYANWVLLKHRDSGQEMVFVNVHLNAGVEEPAGHPKDLPRTRENTRALHSLVELADSFDHPVVIVGDFNVDYGADKRVQDPAFPYSILSAANLSCAWELGEQSTRRSKPRRGRCIDQPWGRGVSFTEVDSLNQWSETDDVESDHLPVVFEFEFAAVAAREGTDSMRFIPYEDWSREPRGATRATHPIGRTKGITAHWEGPGMGGFPHRLCARKVRSIQRFHRGTRGWADIAYNAVVCPHGHIYEGRGAGVKSAANGTTQTNDDWYAVCYLGGVGDPFTEAGKEGFLSAFGWLTREGGAGPRRNGHRDHKPTSCPGDEIYRWVHSSAAHEPPLEDDLPTPHDVWSHRITSKERDIEAGEMLRLIERKLSDLEAKCNGCCCQSEDNA